MYFNKEDDMNPKEIRKPNWEFNSGFYFTI